MARTTGALFLGMEGSRRNTGARPDIARRAVRAGRRPPHRGHRRSVRRRASRRRETEREAPSTPFPTSPGGCPFGSYSDYFGVPGPNAGHDAALDAIHLLGRLLQPGRRPERFASARRCQAARLAPYLEGLLRERRERLSSGQSAPDDFVTRILEQQIADPTIHDDLIRRDVAGIVVGAVDTQSKAIAHAMDRRLRRPAALESARRAARANDDVSSPGTCGKRFASTPATGPLSPL